MIGVRGLAAATLLHLVGACTTAPLQPVADLQPGERPAVQSDEAGLWMRMDAAEEELGTSGLIVTDPALSDYLRGITCRLSAEYCKDLRVYIVRGPQFNATMSPNGTMKVWTGTLLRMQNEAQLAYVLGHEMSHYIRRHSVQRWRAIRSSADGMAGLTVPARMLGIGFIGEIADRAAMSSAAAHSREHEREADEIGFELLVAAGYAGAEAPRVWESLEAERSATGRGNLAFAKTHPTTDRRVASLHAKAVAHGAQGRKSAATHIAAIQHLRAEWLRDELRRADFEGTRVVLDNMLEAGHPRGVIHFYEGELYRLRGSHGDIGRAIGAYRRALASEEAPPETHRALGLMLWKSGRTGPAHDALRAYLAAEPMAEDRAMIESYLRQLGRATP
ncbi:MAG: M48 family metalloprotease [Rhodospirillales bacterium]|nr:MAG: M48 family metalloprotease [Rhodospirillales bacterium]